MADYEELVELGFEGVDKFADKYHDQVYDHLPAWKRKKHQEEKHNGQKPQEQQSREIPQEQQNRSPRSQPPNQQQRSSRHPDKGYSRPRSAPSGNKYDYEDDPEMYAPDRRQERDYRGADDGRYREEERPYNTGPDAGAVVPRGYNDFNQSRGYGAVPYQAPPQRGYDQSRDYADRGRPAPRRRGSSWSPPREKHGRDGQKRRARSRSKDKQHRIMATVGGALAGGFAGNRAMKGQKFDTVATIVGAIVGGVGAREASEFWDGRKKKREETEKEWEEEYSDGRGSDRRRDDRHERDDRRRR